MSRVAAVGPRRRPARPRVEGISAERRRRRLVGEDDLHVGVPAEDVPSCSSDGPSGPFGEPAPGATTSTSSHPVAMSASVTVVALMPTVRAADVAAGRGLG